MPVVSHSSCPITLWLIGNRHSQKQGHGDAESLAEWAWPWPSQSWRDKRGVILSLLLEVYYHWTQHFLVTDSEISARGSIKISHIHIKYFIQLQNIVYLYFVFSSIVQELLRSSMVLRTGLLIACTALDIKIFMTGTRQDWFMIWLRFESHLFGLRIIQPITSCLNATAFDCKTFPMTSYSI